MAAVSVVNGFFGDLLHERQNGLTIDMAFYDRNRPLALTRDRLLALRPQPTGKLCVFVHGLACHEGVWTFANPDDPQHTTSYGAQLYADLGYTPLFLRYNTGLPIGVNGQKLASLLDELLACYPLPVEELVLIGHSMGGLVIRSACYYGAEHHLAWVPQVSRVFYLGTPHDGADLERLAHGAATTLEALPNPITQIIGRFLNQRSQGVKDLRHGTLVAPDGSDAARPAQKRQDIPWLSAAEHFLVAGALTEDPEHIATLLLGDGLVALPPYAAAATPVEGRLPISPTRVRVFPRVHHLKLTRDPDVYQQIYAWCVNPREE
jgi:pimeloyl-ACP methyl ester carboxylesterase